MRERRWEFTHGPCDGSHPRRVSMSEREVAGMLREFDSATGSGLRGRRVMKIRADGALVYYDDEGRVTRIKHKDGTVTHASVT